MANHREVMRRPEAEAQENRAHHKTLFRILDKLDGGGATQA